MADLLAGQIPLVANVPNGMVGKILPANVVTIGVDTSGVDCYIAGSKGGRVMMCVLSTDDTVASNIYFWILRVVGATTYILPLSLVALAGSSGNTNVVRFSVNCLDGFNLPGLPSDNATNKYLQLMPNDKLRAGSLVALTAGKTVWVSTNGNDYQ